jgi:RNA polymerase sigma factor (TIGR02999 family)
MDRNIPQLLERLRAGNPEALGALVDLLYDELRRIAAGKLRAERTEHTLQTTALVHEVYLKLVGEPLIHFSDRGHFLAVAARVMRQVLVDYSRARSSRKRGGGAVDHTAIELVGNGFDDFERVKLLDLDRALDELAAEDPGLANLIEMRYFAGMTAEESAEALGKSVHVVRHDLRLAQAWLRRKMAARDLASG